MHEGRLARYLTHLPGNIIYQTVESDSFSNKVDPTPEANVTVGSLLPPVREGLSLRPSPEISHAYINNNYGVNMMPALERCIAHDYQVPKNLPNVQTKVRPSGKNVVFHHNVFGLCICQHINNGECC